MFTCVSTKILPPRISCLGAIITPPRTSHINDCLKKGSLVGLQKFCKMSILHLSSYINDDTITVSSGWARTGCSQLGGGDITWPQAMTIEHAASECRQSLSMLRLCSGAFENLRSINKDWQWQQVWPPNQHIFYIDSQCILVIMSTFSLYDKLLRLVLEDRHVWLICTEGLTIGIQPFLFICAVRS